MGIMHKRYFDLLRLLRALDVEENPEPRASRLSFCVVYANIRGLNKNLSD